MADTSVYNGQCEACIMNNASNYYCTMNNQCLQQYVFGFSCEQQLSTCLDYVAIDLGLFEIAPYNKSVNIINYTIPTGSSIKFAVTNEDSTTKGYMELQLYQNGQLLNQAPSSLYIYTYVPSDITQTLQPYVFSPTGKTNLQTLGTNFYYAAAVGSSVTLQIQYGNTKYLMSNFLKSQIIGLFCLVYLLY